MRLRPSSPSKSSSLWAGIPLLGMWLAAVLLTWLAAQASARGAFAVPGLSQPQAPNGTIVDSDVVVDTVWTVAGSPYRVAFASSGILVAEGVKLRVEPGVEVQFDPYASLIVQGTLTAIGTTDQPILFTGVTKEAGSWLFIAIESTSLAPNQGSVLRHVIIEYAQWNLMVSAAAVHLENCVLRHASETGLWTSLASGTVVEGCQIVDNGAYGLENAYGGLILAANNWWGAASGPYHEGCNPAGTGDAIEDSYSQGVVFRPFLTAPDQEPAPVAAADALRLSLAPQRWFAPADGLTLIPVQITLWDGAGRPLAGRTVCLYSDLGTAGGCSLTDGQGRALTYVASDEPGDATLTGFVEGGDDCEYVAGPEAMVTFVEAADDALLPGAESPYMNGQIEIAPKPIIQGVPSMVQARLVNPNPYPIDVNATFRYAEYGIGLAFAPLGGVEDVRIEANSEGLVSVPWTPPASGHVCLRIDYAYEPVGRASAGTEATSGGGQTNFSIDPGPLGSPGTGEDDEPGEEEPEEGDPESEKDMLNKVKAAMDAINDGQMALDAVTSPENLIGLAIPNLLFSYGMDWVLGSYVTACEALGTCPPRQDYDTYATLDSYSFTPLVPGEQPTGQVLSPARAAAGNALMAAMLELTAELRAATVSFDRYSGAANADDLYWASEQAAMLIYYKKASGARMLEVADRIGDLLVVLRAEGVQTLDVQVSTVEAYQARLAALGFEPLEIQAAQMIGLSSYEIEVSRLARISADPAELAGDVMVRLEQAADDLRLLAAVLMNPPNFDETGTARAVAVPTAGTNLARIFASQTPFQIGNPLAEAASVELRVRNLDLPPDWMVSVSPQWVDLAAGERAAGQITVRPGLAAVQGTQPRVAVEGYIDDELIGGVVVEVMVPRHVVAGPKQRVYLPLVLRR